MHAVRVHAQHIVLAIVRRNGHLHALRDNPHALGVDVHLAVVAVHAQTARRVFRCGRPVRRLVALFELQVFEDVDGVDCRRQSHNIDFGGVKREIRNVFNRRECTRDMRPFICRNLFPVAAFIRCSVRAVVSSDGKHNSVCRRDRRLVIEAQRVLRVRLQMGVCVFADRVAYNAPARLFHRIPRHPDCAHTAIQILFDGFPACLHRPVPVDRSLIRVPQQIPTAHRDAVNLRL